MNLILLPFLATLLTIINCEQKNKLIEPNLLSLEKSKVIEKHNSNNIVILDTLTLTNVSFLKLLKNNLAFSTFENASKVEKEIKESTYDGSVKKHSKIIYYSKKDSVRFFLREKKYPQLLNSEIYSNILISNSLLKIGLLKNDFLKKYAELYTEKMHSENLNLYGVNPEKLIKKIPDVFYLTDAEGLSFFEFKFKNDKLISIIYQNNNWE